MNEIKVTLTGNVVADPETKFGRNGSAFTVFRVAVNEGWMSESGWVDGGTTFMRVSAFGSLGKGVAASLRRGQPVLVHGKLRVDSWTTNTGDTRTTPEVRATVVGHDLGRGTAAFLRFAREDMRSGSGPAPGPAEQGGTSAGDEHADGQAPTHRLADRLGAGASAEPDAWTTEGPDSPFADAQPHRTADGLGEGCHEVDTEDDLIVDRRTGEVLSSDEVDVEANAAAPVS